MNSYKKEIHLGKKYNFLRPIKQKNLFRLGNKSDGGYVMEKKTLTNASHLLSFGVGDNWSFEKDCLKINKKLQIYMDDHTIDIKVFFRLFFKNFRRFITFRSSFNNIIETFKVLKNYLELKSFSKRKNIVYYPFKITNQSQNKYEKSINNELKNLKNVVIKCDVEGDEYGLFKYLFNDLKKIDMMVIEFHWVEKNFTKFKELIKKFQKSHSIIHFHVNNNSKYNQNKLPDFVEITFLIKQKADKKYVYKNCLPNENLDFPNNLKLPDYKIYFNQKRR